MIFVFVQRLWREEDYFMRKKYNEQHTKNAISKGLVHADYYGNNIIQYVCILFLNLSNAFLRSQANNIDRYQLLGNANTSTKYIIR